MAILIKCSQCGIETAYLIENMCQKCYDEAMNYSLCHFYRLADAGNHDHTTPEDWLKKINGQLDLILADIKEIIKKLQ